METERPLRQVLLRFVAQELGLGGSSLHTGHNADPAEPVAMADRHFPRLFIHAWSQRDALSSLVATLPEPISRRGLIVDQISDLSRALAAARPDMRTCTMFVSSETEQLALRHQLPVLAVPRPRAAERRAGDMGRARARDASLRARPGMRVNSNTTLKPRSIAKRSQRRTASHRHRET